MDFRGHYDYSLDAKNRLNIPPRYRAAFSDGVFLSVWLDPCVAVWTPEGFQAFTQSLLPNLNPVSPERRKLTRFFHKSFSTELDAAGRITVPPSLLEHAGIEKEVVIGGSIDHLEIWDRERWLADQDELMSDVVQLAESLGNSS